MILSDIVNFPPFFTLSVAHTRRTLKRLACFLRKKYFSNKKGAVTMYRPPKVRPKNLTFGGRYFLWLSILLNLN
ncbi:hypothetical protein DVY42_01630 [Enterococcus faecium]|nr:hypothetical protein F6X81_04230 [Enterococcus faecium]KAA9202060.1 hypothetical protein F6X75_04375 [Enterococcus faecium]KAA9203227.1 hypothetical protein F6X82_04365 [Enterococcus faecium]TKN44095.1 hypothetical protein DVW91_01630 [Enterococcus faecium]TKN51471.1 hypothetical protein DVW96_01665 [Enterococcus faecium]